MPANKITWVVIADAIDKTKPIGAVGFIGGKAAVVVSFYEDYDANRDGSVGWGEWLAATLAPVDVTGRYSVEVAQIAKTNFEVLRRDGSFKTVAEKMLLNFAVGLVADGVYATYIARGVTFGASGLASKVTSSSIKHLMVRKGMEAAVKKAFRAAT